MQKSDLYKILGLKKDASKEEIKKAFHQLAHRHHPDKKRDDDSGDYIRIREAFETLFDEEKRRDYDHAEGDYVPVNIRRYTRPNDNGNSPDDFSIHEISDTDDFIEMIFRRFFNEGKSRYSGSGTNHIHYDDLIR